MKLKALVLAAAVASCQPTSIYPQEASVVDTYSFGIPPSPNSSVTVFDVGNGCEDIVFDNQLTNSTDVVSIRLAEHYIMLIMGHGEIPDEFSVTPAPGYVVMGDSHISVPDEQLGTITVCQEAMS